MRLQHIHPEARAEFDEAFEHYLQIDRELAKAFDSLFRYYRKQICENPLLYNIRAGSVRRVNLTPQFGEHYIAYMLWHDQVVILAVAHAKRRPYYWRHRIGESKQMF